MKNIWTIAKREFWSYLNSPTAYIVAVAFIVPSFYLFWTSLLYSGEATMRSFFALLPWFLLLLAPALTMRSLSEEKKQQTLDLLLAHPVSELQVVVGKFFGSWLFFACLLGLTLSLPVTMSFYAHLEYGQLVAQYIGALLAAAGFLALGIMVSAWMSNVITSFMTAAGLSFVWILLGLDIVLMALPAPFNGIVQEMGVMSHIEQIARGVISLRDMSFFIVSTAIFLLLAAMKLMEPKTVESRKRRSFLYTGFGLLLAIGIVGAVASYNWPVRLDLTRDKRYTLSPATQQTLGNLKDIVTITMYSSTQLPARYQLTKREAIDTLQDYVGYGKGNIKFSVVNPDADPQIAQQAAEAGIQPAQFETRSSSKLAVESGYLGLVVGYGDKKETIAFLQDPSNLEFDLTRRIRKLTSDKTKAIGLVSGQGEKTDLQGIKVIADNLKTEFEVTPVDITTEKPTPDTFEALLVVGPTEPAGATAAATMNEYLQKGGRAMFLLDAVEPNTQLGTASFLDTGWNTVTSAYGITLNQDLAYDVMLNQAITMSQGPIQYSIPYPFWPMAIPNKDFASVSGLEGVLLGWPSTLKIANDQGAQVTELLSTSQQGGGVQTGVSSIAPDSAPQTPQGKSAVLAAAAEKNGSRIVVVADSDLANDNFTQYKQVNVSFVSNLVDWLTTKEGELVVPKRAFTPPILQMTPEQATWAQYGNLLGVPLLLILFGFLWLRRRRLATRRMLTLQE